MKHLAILGFLFSAALSDSYKSNVRGGIRNMKSFNHDQSLTIKVGTQFVVTNAQNYELQCQGAIGQISYHIDGLPDGASLVGDTIEIGDHVKAGNYILRIRAQDQSGKAAQKFITLSVVHREASDQSSGSSSGSSSSSGGDSRLNNVINSYSTVTSIQRSSYQNNKFPQINFPTGANQNMRNIVPQTIASTKAQTSSANRNTITSQDVALRAASERHQNAVKAITNILKIIDQARANRNYAQNSLQAYVSAYNDALIAQRKAQNQIISAETRRSQIISALEGVQGKIGDLNMQIRQLETTQAEYRARKNQILAKIAGEEKIKAQLLAELEKINAALAQKMKEIAEYKEKCSSIEVKINGARANLKKYQDELASVVERRIAAEKQVDARQGDVEDLRKKLQAAEGALANAKIKLSGIQDEEKRIPGVINDIKIKLDGHLIQLDKCEAKVAEIQAMIDSLDTNDLTGQIDELQISIMGDRRTVLELDESLAGLVEPLENFKAQLKGAQEDLAFLKMQIVASEEALRQSYIKGNDANTAVAHCKQNLDAVNARYLEEEKIITEATLNLERARAEEALARLALEEVIAHYSDALPYSIVPNGNGETAAGTPFGNNPSGSALGPVKKDGDGAPGKFKISNWTHYLSMAYGSGVNPAFKGSVTTLYPFNFHSTVDGHNVHNNYEKETNGVCGGNGPVRIASGTIVSIGENDFTVKLDNGEHYKILLNPCTKMNANVEGYDMKEGDEAIVKGTQKGYNSMSASQMTCLSD